MWHVIILQVMFSNQIVITILIVRQFHLYTCPPLHFFRRQCYVMETLHYDSIVSLEKMAWPSTLSIYDFCACHFV